MYTLIRFLGHSLNKILFLFLFLFPFSCYISYYIQINSYDNNYFHFSIVDFQLHLYYNKLKEEIIMKFTYKPFLDFLLNKGIRINSQNKLSVVPDHSCRKLAH